jgi:16S rRNA (guanine966-N2)-methyltransferase
MKITGGKSRGRLLATLKGLDIRPTSSKVREAIFNILGQDMSGISVLDIFAGTGILGIEALSRGAECAKFIDRSDLSISLINRNLASCGYQDISRTFKIDLIKGPGIGSISPGRKIDLVFIDPPYRKGIIPPVLQMLSSCGILADNATLVVESSRRDTLPEREGTLILTGTRTYGDTKLDIYKNGH